MVPVSGVQVTLKEIETVPPFLTVAFWVFPPTVVQFAARFPSVTVWVPTDTELKV
jgi:hypothetical protein